MANIDIKLGKVNPIHYTKAFIYKNLYFLLYSRIVFSLVALCHVHNALVKAGAEHAVVDTNDAMDFDANYSQVTIVKGTESRQDKIMTGAKPVENKD